MRKHRWALLLTLGWAGQALVAESADAVFTPQQKQFWSLQPVARPALPAAAERDTWARTPVDAFILAKLRAKGVQPNPAADKLTLLRRVTFDLIGLPPTPAEVDAFLSDPSPNAYQKVVERLLASPHYGERWARHWLDLARYAESEGFKADETRPNAWRYRDYVIQSFNDNKPYDRFVREQIAGDELWPDQPAARIATGFLRHYPDESNARNLMQRRQEILHDITDTVGSTFLGLTYGCARCHTHKYDPILHADYYRLQAYFANTAADDAIPLWPADKVREHQAKRAAWEAQTKDVRTRMAALLEPRKKAIIQDFVEKYPPEIQDIIAKQPAQRTPYEWQMYAKAKPYLSVDDATAAKALKGDEKKQYEALRQELAQFAHLDPGELPIGSGMTDLSAKAPATHILTGGAWDAPQAEVQPGPLTILDASPAAAVPSPEDRFTGRRTALANWLTSADNPLTARVMVNRIWHYHFGQGLVSTPSDFGAMGARPTHPELLDWLASEFVRSGWDMKQMHRLMVLSSTYQQSSAHTEASAKLDGRNRLWWKFPRQRLEGEVIRDSALAVAGLLNAKTGGPSVFPGLPDNMPTPRGGWALNADPAEQNRRSVYIFVRRNTRYPMLEAFDMPDTHESCGRRNQTVTAPQAMTLLNNRQALEWARAFAGRVLTAAGADTNAQIETAWRLAYGRKPGGDEKDTALTFLSKQKNLVAERVAAGQKTLAPAVLPAGVDVPAGAALADLCHMLLNSNEFAYRN